MISAESYALGVAELHFAGFGVAESDPVNKQASVRSRRNASRDSLFLSATIRKVGESADGLKPVRVRNLSAIGLMADHNDRSAPGDKVIVSLRGIGSVDGTVAWVRSGRIGIAFDEQIDPKLARKPVKPTPAPPRPLRPIF
jgi:hypothetical protein